MAITPKQYAEALLAGTQEIAEKDYDKVINNLIEILKTNNDLSLFEKIITEFETLSASAHHSAKITSAGPINVDKDILTSLNKIAGEKLTTENEIDESFYDYYGGWCSDFLPKGYEKNLSVDRDN